MTRTIKDEDILKLQSKGRVQKKNVKVWSLTKLGGGHPKPNPYCKNNFFLRLTICPQTYPIHKEIVVSAVLVINSLCGDHFLIS